MDAYIAFYNFLTPYCPIAKKFEKENPVVKDVKGLVGDRRFSDFYPTFVLEYGEFPYYGRVNDKIVIFSPLRNENERDKVFKDFEAFRKIIREEKVRNLMVSTVYPIKFFYAYASNLSIKSLFFIAEQGSKFKVVSVLSPNPLLCKNMGF